jgi:predicted nucleotidyltransferase
MTSTLLNLSPKIDKLFLAIFESLDTVASEIGIPYFIVGATARDMILSMGYGIDISRATADIDLGINVSSWDEFNQLKEALTNTGRFSEHRARQRLIYDNSIPVDIVPFGAISNADGNIRWPPDQDEVMNIVGFEDAFKLAQPVRLREEPPLDINFASPLGLAVMKLIAWADRNTAGNKDAIDLATVLRTYLDAGNRERLYNDHPDLLTEDFDYVLAGAELLGRDIASSVSSPTKRLIIEILRQETDVDSQSRLAEDMSRRPSTITFEQNYAMLLSMKKGITS